MNESHSNRAAGTGYRVRGAGRRVRRALAATVATTALAALVSACDGASSAQPVTRAATTVDAPSGHAATPHGDHTPHHGGAVLMHRDLHYEVVLPPEGGARLYLTDEVREDLPASVVSSVVIEIARPTAAPEPIELAMDAGGEFWSGRGRPVAGSGATVRVGFAYDNETVSVDLPYESYFGRPAVSAVEPPTASKGAR